MARTAALVMLARRSPDCGPTTGPDPRAGARFSSGDARQIQSSAGAGAPRPATYPHQSCDDICGEKPPNELRMTCRARRVVPALEQTYRPRPVGSMRMLDGSSPGVASGHPDCLDERAGSEKVAKPQQAQQ